MIPARWAELEPWLDQALEADAAGRDVLLGALDTQDPELAGQLRAMLDDMQAAEAAHYLQQGPEPPVAPATPLAGLQLGAYTLVEPIGEGGMGSVWLARRSDGRYEGQAAVKLLHRGMASAAVAERFRREGQILARLDHPNIARLLDAGVTTQGQAYLVLEHVRGMRIDHYADAHRLGVRERLQLFVTLLAAVAHAHRHLVVHRDIKPGNVLVSDGGQVKLLDFGIAKLLADELPPDAAVTQQAASLLTPGHAAPEQYLGQPVSTATDVYALGVLLYGLLAGRHPTLDADATAAQALHATLQQDAPWLSRAVQALPERSRAELAQRRATEPAALCRQLRGDLDNIVALALRRPAAERYADAAAFADDLQRHLGHLPVRARPPGAWLLAAKFLRRQRVPATVAAVALAALAVVGGQAWRQQQAAREGQARARSVDGLLQSLFDGMSPDNAAQRSFSARELLDRGSAYLDRGADLDPETRRDARLRMAALYRDIGAYPQAAAAYRTEAEAAAVAGQRDRQAAALLDLANLQLKTPDTSDQARLTLATVDTLLDPSRPADAPWRARHAALSAERQLDHGDPRAAAAALARAAAQLAALPQVNPEWLARVADLQAEAALQLGDPAAARQHLQQAAKWQAQRGAAGTVDRLNLALRLGRLQNFAGDFDGATTTLSEALAALTERLGPQHLWTLAAAPELAYAQMRGGHFAEARKTVATLGQAQGADAVWRRVDAQRLLALMDLYEGRADAAEPALRQVLETVERAEGGPTARTEPLRRLHAEALLRQNRLAEAEAELRLTERQQLRLSHAGHSSVAITRVLIGCVQARRGALDAARQTWADASAVLQREPGSPHPFALAAASYLALTEAPSNASAAARAALARRVDAELGWQSGAAELSRRLLGSGGIDWPTLPVVL